MEQMLKALTIQYSISGQTKKNQIQSFPVYKRETNKTYSLHKTTASGSLKAWNKRGKQWVDSTAIVNKSKFGRTSMTKPVENNKGDRPYHKTAPSIRRPECNIQMFLLEVQNPRDLATVKQARIILGRKLLVPNHLRTENVRKKTFGLKMYQIPLIKFSRAIKRPIFYKKQKTLKLTDCL